LCFDDEHLFFVSKRAAQQAASSQEAIPAVARNLQLGNDSSTVSLCQSKKRRLVQIRGFLALLCVLIATRKSPGWAGILLTMMVIRILGGSGRRSYVASELLRRQRLTVRPS
jgi:hypothetical protein